LSELTRSGLKWSREETIVAFDLYTRTSFGKISSTNIDVINLATLLRRTPNSVALKMHNLAHFDPALRKRNVMAMSHGSKLDSSIWEEFNDDWDELAVQARYILEKLNEESCDKLTLNPEVELYPEGLDKEQLARNRIGQYFFRMAVLSAYDNRCCITGLAIPELLIASHIKPWKDSDIKTERTNPMNGLALNALFDKAFDRGLITINLDYKIFISSRIKPTLVGNAVEDWMLSYAGRKIILPNRFLPKKEFLEYHNDFIFVD